MLAIAFACFTVLPLSAKNDPSRMQITTKSPRARALFEEGLKKMELLHLQAAGVESMRQAVQADPHFALGHIFITFFSQDPVEQVVQREKALATRQYAGPEEQLVIQWVTNASQGHWVPAIQAMNSALDRYPHDKDLAWMAGRWLLVLQRQGQRALVLFERAIKIDPQFADAWNEIAYCYASAGDFDKAFAAIRHYADLIPNQANPQDSFAEISRLAGRFDDALEHYRKSLKIDPSFLDSQLGLGDTYALMGDQPRARAEYAIAIQEGAPVQKVAWGLQWAATYVRDGDLTGADLAFRQIAQQARELGFANYEAEAYRSMALCQKEDIAAAELLRKAEAVLQEDHKAPQALLNEELAAVWRADVERTVHDGDSARAQALLQRLSDLAASNNTDALIGVAYSGAAGGVYLAQGNYAEAILDFQDDGANPISMRGLLVAYEKSGQRENAERTAAALASVNMPVIEQALVVPEFRKEHDRVH